MESAKSAAAIVVYIHRPEGESTGAEEQIALQQSVPLWIIWLYPWFQWSLYVNQI